MMIRKIKNSSAAFLFSSGFLILSACGNSDNQAYVAGDPLTPPTVESSGITDPVVSGSATGGLKVVIQQAKDFSTSGLALLERARSTLEKVLNSEEFKQRVLHFQYQGSETFVQNDGYTNLQIYNLIMAGAEQYPKATSANQAMDLYLQLYSGGSGVIGYTDPSTSTISMNSYYFNSYSAAEVAGNMTHEWLHKVGFDHDYNSTARRPYSVPYAIGYLAEELAAKY